MRGTRAWRMAVAGLAGWVGALAAAGAAVGAEGADELSRQMLETGAFSWQASSPVLEPDRTGPDPQIALKDPTIVRFGDRWHLFCTVRQESGKVDIAYLNFADWSEAPQAKRHLLGLHDQYYCAPQVFYYRPHARWYLLYQMADDRQKPSFGPAWSSTETLDDPRSWSKPRWLLDTWPEGRKWLDFWILCDDRNAHLFYTSLDGRMWHAQSSSGAFPGIWSEPELAIEGDIFEASHTYRLQGMDRYLTIVEAQGDGRRYYKAYLAETLAGPWRGLADSPEKPFASLRNVRQREAWTASISHGELIRSGIDERMEVDPARLEMLFQGASDKEYRQTYGKIPWRLGLLHPAP